MRGDELLAAVYAAPEDDVPRAVYADWLQQRDDPLGELIALQLARRDTPPTPKAWRREATLIQKHRKAWLGPLWDVVSHAHLAFDRGFVSEVRLRAKISAQQLARATGDRRWTTVRALDMWGYAYAELLLHDVLRNVRVLGSALPELALPLLLDERPRRIRDLEIQAAVEQLAAPVRDALRAAVGLPELRHLRIRVQTRGPDAFDWLWTSPLGERIDTLTLIAVGGGVSEWQASDRVPSNVTCVRFHSESAGPLDITTLRRGPSGRLDQLEQPER